MPDDARRKRSRGCSSRPRRRLHRHGDQRRGADASANPYLLTDVRLRRRTPQEDVRPFELERFVDPQARDGFLERLARDGAVTDYLLRLRRADRSPMWVEVTAHAERGRRRCASRR